MCVALHHLHMVAAFPFLVPLAATELLAALRELFRAFSEALAIKQEGNEREVSVVWCQQFERHF